MNFERLQEIAADDADLAITLIAMFTDQAPLSLQEIESALTAQDGNKVKTDAHTLKGVCLNMGLDDLGDTCKSLEEAGISSNFDQAQTLFAQLKEEVTTATDSLNAYAASLNA